MITNSGLICIVADHMDHTSSTKKMLFLGSVHTTYITWSRVNHYTFGHCTHNLTLLSGCVLWVFFFLSRKPPYFKLASIEIAIRLIVKHNNLNQINCSIS